MKISRNFVILSLLALALIAAYLRIEGAAEYYYNADEQMHLSIARGDTLAKIWHYAFYEAHPPLTYFFFHYWLKLGDSPEIVRLFPLLCGLALIFIYYRMGRYLRDPLTGLCLAALITFSGGAIILSYMVRQYALFMVFFSLSYYAYWRWKRDGKSGDLAAYGLFGLLACATHFSGLFGIFSIAAVETISRLRARLPVGRWAAVNIIIAVATIALFMQVDSGVQQLTTGGRPMFELKRFLLNGLSMLVYPFLAIMYVMPSFAAGMLGGYFLPMLALKAKPEIKPFLTPMWMAFAVGAALTLFNHCPMAGTRHGYWILPFVLLPAGWLLADMLRWLHSWRPVLSAPILLALLVAGLWAVSDYPDRFRWLQEYQLRKPEWDKVSAHIAAQGPQTLVVAERGDAFLLNRGEQQFYDAITQNAVRSDTVLLPYGSTHLLVPVNYASFILPDQEKIRLFRQKFIDAEKAGLFDKVDTILFFLPAFTISKASGLIKCDDVRKNSLTFQGAGKKDMKVTMVSISKRDLFEQVLDENGKAHHCLLEDN